jgi:hypothetical protein
MSKNRLFAHEMYELTRHVESCTEKFRTWDEAVRYFAKLMGRSISRSNVETGLSNLKKTAGDIIETNEATSPLGSLLCQMKSLRLKIESLAERVTKIENDLR